MDKPSEAIWQTLWLKSKGSIYQSWAWLTALEGVGEPPRFILFKEQDSIKAGIAGYERTLVTPLGRKKILQIKGDPVYATEEACDRVLEEIVIFSRDYFYTIVSPSSEKISAKLESNGFSKSLNSTIVLDLKASESELWSKLEKKSIRWGIKTAEKNGLTFSTNSNTQDLDNFYTLYVQTSEEGKFHAESKELIASLIKNKLAKLFTIKKNKEILAGGLVLIDSQRKTTMLDMTAASSEGLKQQAMPFLYWNMILSSKSTGDNFFDLGGYDLDAKEGEKTYNINKFKERFGGQVTELPVYSSNRKYSTVRSLMKKFRFIKKLYKKN